MAAGKVTTLLSALLLIPGAAATQMWAADVSAGVTTHEGLTADVGTRSAMLGLRHEGPVWGYAMGGVPLDGKAIPWGAAGMGGRPRLFSLGLLAAGVDLSGQGHAYRVAGVDGGPSSGGWGATAHALPFVGWNSRGGGVEVHGGGGWVTQSLGDGAATAAESRGLGEAGLTGWIYLSPLLAMTGEARYLLDSRDDYAYVGGRGVYTSATGEVRIWAEAGAWRLGPTSSTRWGFGAELQATPTVHLSASYLQEGTEPLYWNLPWRGWSVGLTHRFRDRSDAAVPSAVTAPPIRSGGGVRITLPITAGNVHPAIAGDFTDWKAVPMAPEEDEWVLLLPLDPGVYHYVFIDAQGQWFVPEGVPTVEDGMGGESAVLVVP